MKKLIITIFAFAASYSALFSQNQLKDYLEGYCITFKNDTVWGYIKKSTLVESCAQIVYKKDSVSEPLILLPEKVKAYKRGRQVYITRRVGNAVSSPLSFVIPVIKGELSMYSRWIYDYKHGKPGDKPIQKEETYLQIYRQPLIVVNYKRFQKQVSEYISEYKALSLKVLTGEETDINAIVNEYNLWHKNGKVNLLTDQESKDVEDKLNYLRDSKFSIYVFAGWSKSYLSLEDGLDEFISVEESYGPDLGFGFQYSISGEFKLGFGARYWETQLNPSYHIQKSDPMNDTIVIQIKEKSKFNNTSIYFNVLYDYKWIFAGVGVNIGIVNNYKSEIKYYLNDNDLLYSENDKRSLIFNESYYQSHFDVMLGLKLKTKTNFSFKPFARFSMPFAPLFKTNDFFTQGKAVLAYPITVGLIIDYGLID